MLILVTLLAGCASPPPEADIRSVPDSSSIIKAISPVVTDWLDPTDPEVRKKADTCHMLRTALTDTTHSWLWLELDLSDSRYVRVLGQGALVFGLLTDDGPREVTDTGLFVALTQNANTFLNSTSGPITIRAVHATAPGGPVRLLARLPAVDTTRTVVHHVKPVPERWIQK